MNYSRGGSGDVNNAAVAAALLKSITAVAAVAAVMSTTVAAEKMISITVAVAVQW